MSQSPPNRTYCLWLSSKNVGDEPKFLPEPRPNPFELLFRASTLNPFEVRPMSHSRMNLRTIQWPRSREIGVNLRSYEYSTIISLVLARCSRNDVICKSTERSASTGKQFGSQGYPGFDAHVSLVVQKFMCVFFTRKNGARPDLRWSRCANPKMMLA